MGSAAQLLVAVAAVAVLALAVRGARSHVARARADRLPPGVPSRPAYREHSSGHYDAATAALKAFAAEYRTSFLDGGCGSGTVDALHRLRSEALGHLYQLRMRLPNDLAREGDVTRHIEETDVRLLECVADAQERCRAPLVFPGPMDDVFYRRFYRASNYEAA